MAELIFGAHALHTSAHISRASFWAVTATDDDYHWLQRPEVYCRHKACVRQRRTEFMPYNSMSWPLRVVVLDTA